MKIKQTLVLLSVLTWSATVHAQEMQRTAKGLQYKIFTAGTGAKIKLNDVITFDAIQKTDKDSVLFSTYKMGKPVKLQVQASKNIGDLMELFPMLAVNDSVLAKVPTDSIFVGHEEQRPPFLPKGSNLQFVIKIVQVQSLDEAMAERNAAIEKAKAEASKLKDAEAATLQKYIADNKIDAKTTLSGLKYVITSPSIKAKPLNGDTVFVNYVGHTLDGKIFDTSVESVAKGAGIAQPGRPYEPLNLVLGEGRVIKGWEEGLLLLNEGAKATFIIPSALAYGEGGSGPIAPYSTLIFDLELVKVKRGKHPAAKPTAKTAAKKGTAAKKTATKKTTTAVKK